MCNELHIEASQGSCNLSCPVKIDVVISDIVYLVYL